ncbi:MAG TPA: hemerythrin domain-containing protein [Dehalococcoidia bacterium]|nr:hemerythrin domain-containing protein [Dehalococcoidia bacterium]
MTPVITAATPAAIAGLLREHIAANEQFASFKEAVDRATAAEAASVAAAIDATWRTLAFMENELELHIAHEEGPFFPRLKDAMPAGDRLIDEMVAEHDLIRMKGDAVRAAIFEVLDGHDELRSEAAALRALAERAAEGMPQPQRLAELKQAAAALVEKVSVHFENEEELVFPLASQLLPAGILDQIAQEMRMLEP